MSKHTPGPWAIEDYRIENGDWRSTGLIWGNPGLVARVNCDKLSSVSPPDKIEMFEANARLIAAAPEMLEALEELSRYPIGQGARDRIDAIIAKAKGK